MEKAFEGTSAVVTGASSGIGRAIAIALASAGVSKVLVHFCSNEAGAQQTLDEIRRLGGDGDTVAADLCSVEDRQRLVDSAFSRLGPIQTWVNNAGSDVLTGDAADQGYEAKLRLLLDVDVVGTALLSRLVADRLIAQTNAQASGQPPTMTFIGWDQAPHGMEGEAGQLFAPVKSAVMGLAASFAQGLAPRIRVNTIAPGWIRTAWGESTGDYWNDRATEQSLMHRWGRPEDVARAVLFAADPANTFTTGQTIKVNGGWNRCYRPS